MLEWLHYRWSSSLHRDSPEQWHPGRSEVQTRRSIVRRKFLQEPDLAELCKQSVLVRGWHRFERNLVNWMV